MPFWFLASQQKVKKCYQIISYKKGRNEEKQSKIVTFAPLWSEFLTSGLSILFCWKLNRKSYGRQKSFWTERRWENAPFSFDSFFQQWILWLNCQIKDLTRSSMTSQKWSTNFSFFPRKRKRKLIENTIKSVLTRSKVDVTLESIKGELSCKSSLGRTWGAFSVINPLGERVSR